MRGFSNRDLREHWAPLLGKTPDSLTSGQITYQLRRLRLHGLIERIPKTHRYRVTDSGWRTILFYSHTYNRVLRPGLSQVCPALRASAHSWVAWAGWRDCCWYGISLLEFVRVSSLVM